MNKKAQVSPIFKYIFAIIAGVIILIFFLTFGMRYMGLQQTRSSTELANSMNHFLDALLMAEGGINTQTELPFDAKITITCNALSLEKGYPTKFEKVVFSPTIIDSKQLINAWTLSWKFPFKITNFFYIDDPRALYYLVYDSNTRSQVEKLTSSTFASYMPPIFKRQTLNIASIDEGLLSQIKRQAKSRVKFAFFTTPTDIQSILREIPQAEIVYFNIDEDYAGNVIFYGDDDLMPVMGLPFVYGAIFSDNPTNYNCSIQSAIDHLNFMALLYADKANKIRVKEPDCAFVPIMTSLRTLGTARTQKEITDKGGEVEGLNTQLLENGCNTIF